MVETLEIPNEVEIQAELCRRSFYYFLKQFWDIIITETPVYNWHMKYLCDELQAAAEKVINRENKDEDIVININH